MVEVMDCNNHMYFEYPIKYEDKYVIFNSKGRIESTDGYIVSTGDYYNKFDSYFDNWDRKEDHFFDDDLEDEYDYYEDRKDKQKEKKLSLDLYESYICIIDDIPYQIYAEEIDGKVYVLKQILNHLEEFDYRYYTDFDYDKEEFVTNSFYFDECYVVVVGNNSIEDSSEFLRRYNDRLSWPVFYTELAQEIYFINKENGTIYYITEEIDTINFTTGKAFVTIDQLCTLNQKQYHTYDLIEKYHKQEKEKVLEYHK